MEVGVKSEFVQLAQSVLKTDFQQHPLTYSAHNSWTIGLMRAYLGFMEISQNSLSLSHYVFLPILRQI
jgi:hypothetical protein